MSIFEGTLEVRLKDGGSHCARRVEVKHGGQWGTVCGRFWNMNNAAVICRQLGCGSAIEIPRARLFWPGSGHIWMDFVRCRGTESALSDCTHRGWGQHHCDHGFDVGVKCSGFVRLVGGDSACSGRVEIHDGSQWSTVCDSAFGPDVANVVCRNL
ncbi:PREDICTED: scavenger receptor cysteine-rich type 1 protein M130-like, partial [Apaloderma vittatum]|uniref:scavenger receptor cysteine-rich type 1 protein M130-like n=1 Tax=Apaloderma vittatum TaxID=57397 RepID=UPI0005215DB0